MRDFPLISTDSCGASDDLVEDGTNGYVIQPGRTDLLRDAMKKIHDQPLESLRRMGTESQRLVAPFSSADVAQKMGRLLESIRTKTNTSLGLR